MNLLFDSPDPQVAPLRERIERRVRFVLRRKLWRLSRAEIRLSDVNGPRGGPDKRCRVELRGSDGSRAVVVSSARTDWLAALDDALARAERFLARQWQLSRAGPQARLPPLRSPGPSERHEVAVQRRARATARRRRSGHEAVPRSCRKSAVVVQHRTTARFLREPGVPGVAGRLRSRDPPRPLRMRP
ncbi:hypothetical protein [Piscinibacter sakaiensis]|uniref:hypothetical protein n=1 Tax=Piscinibacter sakaiensis TaxID=1547922 RepID=UPI00372D0963